jgi:hypothetical protein
LTDRNFDPPETQGPYVPPNIIIPEDWTQARLILTDYLIKTAEAVNAREIAQFQDVSLDSGGVNISDTITGQTWFTPGDPNKFRYGSRTVVNFGTLPNAGTTSVAHGIVTTSNTVFTRIYGVATDPGTGYVPIPYADTGGNHIELNVDTTNVNIVTTVDWTAYTTCYVVLEWVENV